MTDGLRSSLTQRSRPALTGAVPHRTRTLHPVLCLLGDVVAWCGDSTQRKRLALTGAMTYCMRTIPSPAAAHSASMTVMPTRVPHRGSPLSFGSVGWTRRATERKRDER